MSSTAPSSAPIPNSPSSASSLNFPSVHLGSFGSLRLSDFPPSPVKSQANGFNNISLTSATGGSPTQPLFSPSGRVGVGLEERSGSISQEPAGQRRESAVSSSTVLPPRIQHDEQPIVREAVKRRTTVIEHPQSSGSGSRYRDTQPEGSDGRQGGARNHPPRSSITAETMLFTPPTTQTQSNGSPRPSVSYPSQITPSSSHPQPQSQPLSLSIPFPTPPLRTSNSQPAIQNHSQGAVPTPVSAPAGLGIGSPPERRRRLPSTPGSRQGSGTHAVEKMRTMSSSGGIPSPAPNGAYDDAVETTSPQELLGRGMGMGLAPPAVISNARQPHQQQPTPRPSFDQSAHPNQNRPAPMPNPPPISHLRPNPSSSSLKQPRQSSYEPTRQGSGAIPFATSASAGNMILPGERGGPYPSLGITQPLNLGGGGGSGSNQRRRTVIEKPQEEVCLECMMRDRDLIHVDVSSPGVWRRGSDADWEDLLEREREIEVRWDYEEGKKRRLGLQGNDGEEGLDAKLTREVKWRGFTWEEEQGGWGLPKGFRGREEGELLEGGLKELALRMVSPSSHRYKTLQVYLRDQSLLTGERPLTPISSIPDNSDSAHHPMGSGSGPSAPPPRQSHDQRYPGPGRNYEEDLNRGMSNAEKVKRAQMAAEAEEEEERRKNEREARERERSRKRDEEEWQRQIGVERSRSNSRNLDAGYAGGAPLFAQRGQSPHSYQPLEKSKAPHVRPQNLDLDARNRRGISSPGLLETGSPIMDDNASGRYSMASGSQHVLDDRPSRRDREFDGQMQGQPQGSPLRPFSFAVWAGRNGSTDQVGLTSAKSSPGGLRNGGNGVLGRWGGSVTSFFGGSQGGQSGSMMDMHLGLEADARNPQGPNHPRSVSLATPSRSHFFSTRGSRASSVTYDQASLGPSIRSQISSPGGLEVFLEDKKKKGIKGFFKKMGGGRKGKKSSESQDYAQVQRKPNSPRPDEDFSAPLAPPPPISYLVNRTDRPQPNHIRSPSSNSTSGLANLAPLSLSKSQSPTIGEPWHPGQQRSVSAPVVKSPSSGSLLSTSPTSSRYQAARERDGGYQRDSYASASSRRRSSGLGQAVPEDGMEQRWDSGVEVLEPEHRVAQGALWTEEPGSIQAPFRSAHQKAPSSLSSGGTPYTPSLDLPERKLYPFPPSGSISSLPAPNRQKNLPAIPPADRSPSTDSPDSFNAFFGPPDRYTVDDRLPLQLLDSPRGWERGHSRDTSRDQQSLQSSRGSEFDRERAAERLGGKKTRSKFGLKSFFSIGSGLNKELDGDDVVDITQQGGGRHPRYGIGEGDGSGRGFGRPPREGVNTGE